MAYGVLLQHYDTAHALDFEMLLRSSAEWELVKSVELQLRNQHETLTLRDVLALGILARRPGTSDWQSSPAQTD